MKESKSGDRYVIVLDEIRIACQSVFLDSLCGTAALQNFFINILSSVIRLRIFLVPPSYRLLNRPVAVDLKVKEKAKSHARTSNGSRADRGL